METNNQQPNEEESNHISLDGVSARHIENIQSQIDDSLFEKGIEEEVNSNPKYEAFFKQYVTEGNNRNEFIKYYAYQRLMCRRFGEMYVNRKEQRRIQHIQNAYECLSEILQKKLFDSQCLWRAEQIDIPAIDLSMDFKCWEYKVMTCPFIEPITREEVELYKKYLLSEYYTPPNFWGGWQEYDDIKALYESNDDDDERQKPFFFFSNQQVPAWYEFCALRTGKNLLMLPNIRGEKEDFYSNLVHQKERKKAEEEKKNNPPPPPKTDKRPILYSHDKEQLYKFMSMFDTPDVLERAKVMDENINKLRDERIENACTYLMEFAPDFVITEQGNWRNVLINAVEAHKKIATANMLDAAYEEYLFKLEMGLLIESENEKAYGRVHEDIRRIQRERILEGRVLNGEEPNFDF